MTTYKDFDEGKEGFQYLSIAQASSMIAEGEPLDKPVGVRLYIFCTPHGLVVTEGSFMESNYILVAQYDFELGGISSITRSTLVNMQVDALEGRKRHVQADHQKTINSIDEAIRNLQSLEYKPQTPLRVDQPEEDDDLPF